MVSIVAATPVQAYQREASRLTPQVAQLTGKVVTRDAGVSLGPFAVRFSAKDYEIDCGAGLSASFADALDAAGARQSLAAAALPQAPAPNALTRRQAVASYTATRDQSLEVPPVMFTAKA